jgi:pimeloyl-ACP methyl ester carboxylesterase
VAKTIAIAMAQKTQHKATVFLTGLRFAPDRRSPISQETPGMRGNEFAKTRMAKTNASGIARMLIIAGLFFASLALARAATPIPKGTEPPGLTSGKLANRRFLVHSPRGNGFALYYGSGSLDGDPQATRAIIIVHGVLRNADTYFATGEKVLAQAQATHTLLVAPQFVEASDLKGHADTDGVLRWDDEWPGGATAVAPAPISTYAVFDAMLERLATRSSFPKMQEIVVIGHSAGGQIVQRYAAVGIGPDRIAASGVGVHFVVANPSSYLYFDTWRPQPQHGCADDNDWRYGLVGVPAYVTGAPAQLERRYAARDVTYLLGTADTIPNEWDLDTSCAAEAQGAYRFVRGKNYIAYMHANNPKGTSQDYAYVGGVGHDNEKMFASACGVAVIFRRSRAVCAAYGNI